MKKFMLIYIFTFFFIFPLHAEDKDLNDFKIFNIETVVENQKYLATVLQPSKLPIKSLLIISPSIRGINTVEKSNAQYFSTHGYLVILPHLFYTELNSKTPDTNKVDSDYFRATKAAISFVDLMEKKLNLPEGLPVFALGSSLGGINTIILTANYPRIKAAWTAVAGGDLPYIFAHSDIDEIKNFRANHMKVLQLSDVFQYEDYLRASLVNDPLKSCQDIHVPFHQTIALRDTVVPTITQERLAKECPPHSVIRKNLIHSTGSMTVVIMQKEVKAFFENAD